jgi:GTP-binding protein Era
MFLLSSNFIKAEHEYLLLKKPEIPENPKILKISILGVPNSGKSTLINRLLNKKVNKVMFL